MKKSCIRSVFV